MDVRTFSGGSVCSWKVSLAYRGVMHLNGCPMVNWIIGKDESVMSLKSPFETDRYIFAYR